MPFSSDHTARRKLIRDIVSGGGIESQGQLMAELETRNISIGQSSVSRDLEALNVVKIDGVYTIVSDDVAPDVRQQLNRFIVGVQAAGPNLTVITTPAGAAQRVAHHVDTAGWPEVVGTVAGDDTLFIATASAVDQDVLVARLRSRISRQDLS